jgi:hypothetical protein
MPMLVFQPEIFCVPPRGLFECRRLRLRQVDQSPVVPEVHIHELRVLIQSHSPFDESVEMPGQEISQVKRCGFLLG